MEDLFDTLEQTEFALHCFPLLLSLNQECQAACIWVKLSSGNANAGIMSHMEENLLGNLEQFNSILFLHSVSMPSYKSIGPGSISGPDSW